MSKKEPAVVEDLPETEAQTHDAESDDAFDVVVVGSGAAGLAAAIGAHDSGAKVLLVEASEFIGGTTSVSGGQPWVPMNDHLRLEGVSDTIDDVRQYLAAITRGREPDTDRLKAYLEHAPKVIRTLEASTPLRFVLSRFSDYHPELSGSVRRGRSLDVLPVPARELLGEWDSHIRVNPHFPALTLNETSAARASANPKDADTAVKSGKSDGRSLAEISAERQAQGIRTLGGGLVAALLAGVIDRGIEVRRDCRARKLVVDAGEVVGVETESADGESTVLARKGVVLAGGGFESNMDLVKRFLPIKELRPMGPPLLHGDPLIMGLEVGAAIANMSALWSAPATFDGVSTYEEGADFNMLNTPRQQPGVIMVNSLGKRFVNEALPYMHLAAAFRQFDSPTSSFPNETAWLVFDQRVRDRISVGNMTPEAATPDWVTEAASIEDLAEKTGVDPKKLGETVERWNTNCKAGEDPDFGRGTVGFEALSASGPNPGLLVPIDAPKFYAMRIYDGALGSAGGLDIDSLGRVKRLRGGVIPGLYAAGNSAASVFGGGYPGAGATLGQALTFGYLSGANAASR